MISCLFTAAALPATQNDIFQILSSIQLYHIQQFPRLNFSISPLNFSISPFLETSFLFLETLFLLSRHHSPVFLIFVGQPYVFEAPGGIMTTSDTNFRVSVCASDFRISKERKVVKMMISNNEPHLLDDDHEALIAK